MTRPWHGTDRTVVRLAVALVLVLPIIWACWASLQPIDRIFAQPGFTDAAASSPSAPRWQNYHEALTRLPFARFLLNSAIITFSCVVGTALSSSLAGFAFARLSWRGRGFWFAVVLATMMVPVPILLIPQFLIFEHLGWINTYKPLIVPSWLGGSPFYIFLFRQFFLSIPRSYEDAARLDGASDWQLYWQIMLPMAKPVIGAVAALSMVYHWQEFLAPLVYLSDFNSYPVSVGLRMYQAIEGSWANLIMAASLVALLPPLAVLLVTQRYLMRNIGLR